VKRSYVRLWTELLASLGVPLRGSLVIGHWFRRGPRLRIALVEVQDFALRYLHSQLAFAESQASIIDRRGATAKAMADHLSMGEVTLHPTAAEVASEDGRDQFRIGIAQTYAGLLNFEDLEDAREITANFFGMSLAYLDSPAIRRGRIRSYDIAPASSFEELRDCLAKQLAAGASGLAGTIGMPLSDVGWVFEFEQPDASAKIQFGAMGNEQLRAILQDPDGVGYPPSVLFVALETAFMADDGSDGLKWWSNCLDRNRKMAERIGKWLKGAVE
jgi:hypothetical protein